MIVINNCSIMLTGARLKSSKLRSQSVYKIGHTGHYQTNVLRAVRPRESVERTIRTYRISVHYCRVVFQQLTNYPFSNRGALQQKQVKARICPIVKQIWLLPFIHSLSLLFCKFINTTAYHLGRQEPSSLVSCRAPHSNYY